MDISSVNSDLIRGNVTTIILGCLLKEDKYGYEIMKDIEERSAGHYVLKQATLYNQLKRLEKQGLISSYDGSPDETGGGQRRYYTLTFEGRNFLLRERSEYEYSRTILDKLVSSKEFDFSTPVPFDASELRPYTKREPSEEKTKTVYKDKIVEVEKIVQVESKVYLDIYGNEISEEEAARMREDPPSSPADEQALRAKEEEIEALKAQLASMETAADEKGDEELETLKAQLDDMKLRLSVVEQERDVLASKVAELRIASQSVTSEDAEAVKAQLDQKQAELDAKQAELEAKQAELDEVRSRQSEVVMKLLDRQTDYERTIEDLKAREAQLEEELAAMKQSAADSEEEEKRRNRASILEKLDGAKTEEDEDELGEISSIIIDNDDEQKPVDKGREEAERSGLSALFERLKQKESEIDAKAAEREAAAQENATQPAEEAAADVAPSAVIRRSDEPFAYEKDDVNYQNFFYSVSEQRPASDEASTPREYGGSDIKKRLYAKGFKVRPYSKSNTSEFYTLKFVYNNRLNRDTFLIILGIFLLEVAVMWLSLANRVSYKYFLPILLVGTALCLIPTAIYLADRLKRVRANFNFKLSILNRSMLCIELTVICILIGFFALGASVKDTDLILCSIVLPAVIFLNLPISSVVYGLLYRTHRYHTA